MRFVEALGARGVRRVAGAWALELDVFRCVKSMRAREAFDIRFLVVSALAWVMGTLQISAPEH